MPEPIPPLFFFLSRFPGLILLDESTPLQLVTGLNFVGSKVEASVAVGDDGTGVGVVVVKNEGDIGPEANLPAYLNSTGLINIPLNSGTTTYTHSAGSSNNISVVSGTRIVPATAGLYYFESTVWGETTSSICVEALPRTGPENKENKYYRYEPTMIHRNAAGTIQHVFGDSCVLSYENCHMGGSLVSFVRGLSFMSVGHYIDCSVVLSDFGIASPPPYHSPSSSGQFTFSIQKVSLGN